MKTNKLKAVLEKEAEKFIKESANRIPQILESATLSLLGLEKNYNGTYEMDHCNGRNSVLIDAFRRIAQKEAEKLALSYKPTKEDIAGFETAFKREYESQMSYVIRDLAREKAKRDVEEVVSKIKVDVESLIESQLK